MDDQRFDSLARSLVGVSSRRSVVRGLAGGACGGLFALLGLREAAACRGFKAPCKKTGDCCDGPGFRCRNDKCLCPRSKTYCSPS